MAEQHNSSRLSRADAVVIAATGLLLILLVPVLFAKPREQAVRTLCAANLGQIGKAMFLYAGDNAGVLPRAGGRSTVWRGMPSASSWIAPDRRTAFGIGVDDYGGSASITSSFYLLVKHVGVSPRLFVCAADRGTREFKLPDLFLPTPRELADLWDFGPASEAFKHCSYAYHIPYGPYGLTTSRDPNLAVAADRSPWIMSPAAAPTVWTTFMPDIPPYSEHTKRGPCVECARRGNSVTHGRDGQNVLFLDGRVIFQRRAYCGIEKDNIYAVSRDATGRGDPYGVPPTPGAFCIAATRADSLLVHDPDAFPPEKEEPWR